MDETPYKAPQADTVGRGQFRIGKPLLALAAIAAAWFFVRFIQVAEMARQTSHPKPLRFSLEARPWTHDGGGELGR